MKKYSKIIQALVLQILALLSTTSWMSAEIVANTKEGITISAEATVEENGKTRIACTISNKSPYALVTTCPRTPNMSFQFKLVDTKGNHVNQDERWALDHAQIDFPDRTRMGSYSGVSIPPSEEVHFQFYLDDAYGNNAVRGHNLEIKWINSFYQPSGKVTVYASKDKDGKIIPEHEELNHFPGVWTFTVSLPLPKSSEEKVTPPAINPKDTSRQPGDSKVFSNTQKGITISAEAILETNDKTLIKCKLANDSPYPIAIAPHITRDTRFQFKLLDSNRNTIEQDKKSERILAPFGYENSESLDRVILSGVYLHPAEKQDFQFYLEDAYGENAARGRILEVRWNSYYTPPGGTLEVDERNGPNGKIIPGYKVENHFPGVWTFSVSLPLPMKAGEEALPPAIDPKVDLPQPKELPEKADVPKTHLTTTPAPAVVASIPNPWWWALLLIPVLFIARLLMRPRNHS